MKAESSQTLSEYVSASWPVLGVLNPLAHTEALKSLFPHLSLFHLLLPRGSWPVTCPKCCPWPTLLRSVAVPRNAFSISHWESYPSPGNALSLREPPDRLTSTTTVLRVRSLLLLLALETNTRSWAAVLLAMECGGWWAHI